MLSKCYASKRNGIEVNKVGTEKWYYLVSKVKQRSDFGNDYRSFSLMRGKNTRTPLQPYHTKLVAQNFKDFFLHFISNYLLLV